LAGHWAEHRHVILGWSGRILVNTPGDSEQVLFTIAALLLPSLLAAIMVSAILSAIMSTADSQLLVAASRVSHDLQGDSWTIDSPGDWVERLVPLSLALVLSWIGSLGLGVEPD